jgi:hypothetical protein
VLLVHYKRLSGNNVGDSSPHKEFNACGRKTNSDALRRFHLLRDYSTQCPGTNNAKNMLLIDGFTYFGRSGNQLAEFLNALQMSRDLNVTLSITRDNWATKVLFDHFWMDNGTEIAMLYNHLESALCIKSIDAPNDLEGYNITELTTHNLFFYKSTASFDDYVASTMYSIRSIFQHQSNRLCSGIDAIFGYNKYHTKYTVVHSRKMNGKAVSSLTTGVCRDKGCDLNGALEMSPAYIKSILRPLGMLNHTIVLITDGDDVSVIQRLLTDHEIRPVLQMVPVEASWVGGDWTLGIMSDVFIGNPVSTFSAFIAKTRLSFGFGHSYLYRVKTENGEWVNSCGDGCVFDHTYELPRHTPPQLPEKQSAVFQPAANDTAYSASWKRELLIRLDRVQIKYGDLCKINSVEPGNYARVIENPKGNFPSWKVNVDCNTILGMDELDAGDTSVPYPPPEELMPFYSMGGAVNVRMHRKFSNVYLGGEALYSTWTREHVEKQLELLKNFTADETYKGVGKCMFDKLTGFVDLRGKSVLVIGSEQPWLEIICLSLGASKVTTLEYGKIISEHPQIQTLTPDEFRAKAINGTLGLFDGILTHSSIEHAGLGRYGDALNPWGDLLSVSRGYCVTEDDGFMVLGLPIGRDQIWFNAHRIYGYT